MAAGGKRPGAGRPLGSKNRPQPVDPMSAVGGVSVNPRAPALRQMVVLLSGAGMAAASIAAVLEVGEEELREDFARELEHGGAILQAELLARLVMAAKRGSSPAARALLALIADRPEPEAPAAAEGESDVVTRALRILDGGRK